jgi:hypothetical protein
MTQTDNAPPLDAVGAPFERRVGRLPDERADLGPQLTTEQRARLISSGPNAGRVRRAGCYECAWGKVLGCWRCGGR